MHRSGEKNYSIKKYPVDCNSAFEHIYSRQKEYYFCPDIPAYIIDRRYKSAVIEVDRYFDDHKFRLPMRIRNIRSKFDKLVNYDMDEYDKKWCQYWKDIQITDGVNTSLVRRSPNDCYQSVIVIPLSFITKELNTDFTERFRDLIKVTDKRVIFGFLCIDHPMKYYFNKDIDIAFLSIVADMLSLYLVQRQAATDRSNIYNNVQGLINNSRSSP